DGGMRAVELPAAVIGHDDPVDARGGGGLGVLDVEHALEHQLARPQAANPLDIAPAQRAVEILVRPSPGLFDPDPALEIGPDVPEGLAPTNQHLDEPGGFRGNVEDVAYGQARRNGQPVLDVGVALAAHGEIDRHEQRGTL